MWCRPGRCSAGWSSLTGCLCYVLTISLVYFAEMGHMCFRDEKRTWHSARTTGIAVPLSTECCTCNLKDDFTSCSYNAYTLNHCFWNCSPLSNIISGQKSLSGRKKISTRWLNVELDLIRRHGCHDGFFSKLLFCWRKPAVRHLWFVLSGVRDSSSWINTVCILIWITQYII